jgi:hypothetical protein
MEFERFEEGMREYLERNSHVEVFGELRRVDLPHVSFSGKASLNKVVEYVVVPLEDVFSFDGLREVVEGFDTTHQTMGDYFGESVSVQKRIEESYGGFVQVPQIFIGHVEREGSEPPVNGEFDRLIYSGSIMIYPTRNLARANFDETQSSGLSHLPINLRKLARTNPSRLLRRLFFRNK